MSSILMSSALEVGLVIAAGAIFAGMIIAAIAVIVWTFAGFISATHA